jgi:hypothetical protein
MKQTVPTAALSLHSLVSLHEMVLVLQFRLAVNLGELPLPSRGVGIRERACGLGELAALPQSAVWGATLQAGKEEMARVEELDSPVDPTVPERTAGSKCQEELGREGGREYRGEGVLGSCERGRKGWRREGIRH